MPKIRLFFCLLTFLPLCSLTISYPWFLPAEARDQVTLKVGIYENPPKVFTAEAGKPAGIFVDILEYIAHIEGWKLKYIFGTWGQGLDRLEKGEIDLMPDVAYTAARAKIYLFHKEPVLFSWFQVYALEGRGIRSILDLEGKRIAVLERSVQQESFSQLAQGFGLKFTLISLPDYKNLFEKVKKGEADAAITNRFYGVRHAKQFGLEDTAVIFHPTELFFAAPINGSKKILNTIDQHLAKLKKEPQSIYYQSLKRWMAEEVRFRLPAWAKTFGWILGGLFLLTLVGTFILRHQVNVKTRELRQINQEMEQRIADRTAELAAAMKKAQEADRIKSAFLATMSHELRTPLNSIIGFTGILLQGLAGPLNEEQQKQLSMVQSSSRHLLALINDVLDISKIESGQLALSPTTFELAPSIEKIAQMVAPLAEKKGLKLIVDISPDVKAVTTDQRRLEQIILNLLNNAVKFTEKGEVRVLCKSENEDYILSVSDTGIGIPSEALADLFKPFHQVDTGLARKYEGTGLGLSISKRLIEMMGGSIGVESKWGQGSTFTIRFPKNSGKQV